MGRKIKPVIRFDALKSASVVIDSYIIDVLMRDLVGHDQHPAAFLVYLFLFARPPRQVAGNELVRVYGRSLMPPVYQRVPSKSPSNGCIVDNSSPLPEPIALPFLSTVCFATGGDRDRSASVWTNVRAGPHLVYES